ncbi:hypothetical protein [Embleya hyalina]|uniref:Uncharacterized protein n=1 Tax=Embleya hyalina TaxID=516124 RepID=A0A401YR57_9ACTN|nr:hypothetical protein [Embleya hyalina]GCD97083.1 hypothetical protein EHYA_04770 [Embleya hyalina]
MTERTTFQTHLRQTTTSILEDIPGHVRREIYVLGFGIWRIDTDQRRPCVDIGYNTETQYQKEMRPEFDPGEVRWHYAYWILDGFNRLGNVPEDPLGGPLFEEEARNLGIWYDGEFDPDRDLEDESLLLSHFCDAVIDLARYLHASGTIERIFGRPLPVVVFDMESPGWEEEATTAANPAELIEDYLARE